MGVVGVDEGVGLLLRVLAWCTAKVIYECRGPTWQTNADDPAMKVFCTFFVF